MLALGVSAISYLGTTYAQHTRDIAAYQEALSEGRLPVMRGFTLSHEDTLRRRVIQDIMCQGVMDFEQLEAEFGIQVGQHFARELNNVTELVADGLIMLGTNKLQVTPKGRLFLRNIAMVFDEYITAAGPERYSRAI